MAILKHPTTVPPGGFRYKQEQTQLMLTGDSLSDLIQKTVSHRRYKGLKPDDAATVSLEVQRQICTRLGKEECKAEEVDSWVPVPITPRFTLMDILAFSKTLLEFIKYISNVYHNDLVRACTASPSATLHYVRRWLSE